jgi:hypothetical protein
MAQKFYEFSRWRDHRVGEIMEGFILEVELNLKDS